MNLSKIIPSPENLYEGILKKMTVRLLRKANLL